MTREQEDSNPSLSPRHIQCLQLAAQGQTSREIARTLGISPRTVDQYILEACARLNVKTRVQAAAKATRLGIISE